MRGVEICDIRARLRHRPFQPLHHDPVGGAWKRLAAMHAWLEVLTGIPNRSHTSN